MVASSNDFQSNECKWVVFFPFNKNNYVNSTLFHQHHHRYNISIIFILVLPVLGLAHSLFSPLIDVFLTVIFLRVDRRTSLWGGTGGSSQNTWCLSTYSSQFCMECCINPLFVGSEAPSIFPSVYGDLKSGRMAPISITPSAVSRYLYFTFMEG
jgi:hypothetical protein